VKSDHPTIAEHVRAYRRRIAAAGEQEVLVRLSSKTVAVIDELKQRLGLRNRGQVVEQLFEQRREAAQQQAT
jgi:Ribbon-helix-helix protein, copG family